MNQKKIDNARIYIAFLESMKRNGNDAVIDTVKDVYINSLDEGIGDIVRGGIGLAKSAAQGVGKMVRGYQDWKNKNIDTKMLQQMGPILDELASAGYRVNTVSPMLFQTVLAKASVDPKLANIIRSLTKEGSGQSNRKNASVLYQELVNATNHPDWYEGQVQKLIQNRYGGTTRTEPRQQQEVEQPQGTAPAVSRDPVSNPEVLTNRSRKKVVLPPADAQAQAPAAPQAPVDAQAQAPVAPQAQAAPADAEAPAQATAAPQAQAPVAAQPPAQTQAATATQAPVAQTAGSQKPTTKKNHMLDDEGGAVVKSRRRTAAQAPQAAPASPPKAAQAPASQTNATATATATKPTKKAVSAPKAAPGLDPSKPSYKTASGVLVNKKAAAPVDNEPDFSKL